MRKRSRRFSALLGVLGLILMSAGLSLVVQGSASAAPSKVHKSYVCKYVDKPGQAERLQTGQNPIWVANQSLLGFNGLVTVGQAFKDAQGRSVVIVANTPRLNPEPTIADCPSAVTPGVVTPDVQFTDSACVNGAPSSPSWTGTNTADIVYAITSGAVGNGSAITITATPKTGFVFAQGAQTVFNHTFGPAASECGGTQGTPVTSTAALFKGPACPNAGAVFANLGGSGFLSPAQWNAKGNFIDVGNVTYTITGSFAPGGSVNVAASADDGFTLTPSSVTQWTHTFAQAPICSKAHHVTPPPVTIPAAIHSGFDSMGMTSAGTNSALYAWGYSLAGTGAAFFITALVLGRRRQSVS